MYAPIKTAPQNCDSDFYFELTQGYLESLLGGNRQPAFDLIFSAIDQGKPIQDIYLKVIQPAQYEVGRLWHGGEITVAQEHFCTASTQMLMSQLHPLIAKGEKNGRRLLATCIGGEQHEVGLKMVSDFFEMAGWYAHYFGANMPKESIIDAIGMIQPDVVAISASMVFHVDTVAELIEEIRLSPHGKDVKILVGGRPFNISPNLWQYVKADGYATDAQQAVDLAEKLLSIDTFQQLPSPEPKRLPVVRPSTLVAFKKIQWQAIDQAVNETLTCLTDAKIDKWPMEKRMKAGFIFVTNTLSSIMAFGDTYLLEDQLSWLLKRLPIDSLPANEVVEQLSLLRDSYLELLTSTQADEIIPYIDHMLERVEMAGAV